jgi:hypothetical protein
MEPVTVDRPSRRPKREPDNSFESSALDPDTKRYYRNGWGRIESSLLANMRLDRITTEAVAVLELDGSPSWQNQALRTLSVILARFRPPATYSHVADAMGHEDLKTTRIYQHPDMDSIRDAIDQRNNREGNVKSPQNPPQSKQCPPGRVGMVPMQKNLVEPTTGIEPVTCRLRIDCSTS